MYFTSVTFEPSGEEVDSLQIETTFNSQIAGQTAVIVAEVRSLMTLILR